MKRMLFLSIIYIIQPRFTDNCQIKSLHIRERTDTEFQHITPESLIICTFDPNILRLTQQIELM